MSQLPILPNPYQAIHLAVVIVFYADAQQYLLPTPDASNINAINNNALLPLILHDSRNFSSRVLTDHDTHKVQARIQTTCNATRGDDSQSTKLNLSTTSNTLAAGVTLLPSVAALACHGWTSSSNICLAADIWVLVEIAQVEPQVIDHVSLFHEIAAFCQLLLRTGTADILELCVEIGVCGGRQAIEDALLSEEEGAGVDGEESSFLLWIFLLDVGVGLDEVERLGLLFIPDDVFGVAARDDDDVELVETVLGFIVTHVRTETGTLGRDRVFIVGAEGDLEGFGSIVIDVVPSIGQDLERAHEVHGVHARVHCD